jgi:glutamate dehydrogenase
MVYIKNKVKSSVHYILVLQFEPAKIVLSKMLDAVRLTLRTNFYSPNRYALSLRLHPSIMMTGSNDPATGTIGGKAVPFGVFFVHGRNFNAFHCR